MRCLWMLEEMGEPYQLIEKSTRTDELQTSEYLRLNPNARIPTLVDGDVVLWESMDQICSLRDFLSMTDGVEKVSKTKLWN
jgi:glutathione S-transferase